MKIHPLVLGLFLSTLLPLAAAWQPRSGGGGTAEVGNDGSLTLSLSQTGEVAASSDGIAVTPGDRMAVAFDYTASGLSGGQALELSVHWYNAAGDDLDVARLPLGFPPFAQVWTFVRNGKNPVHVGDNLTVPPAAAKARFVFRLARQGGKAEAARVSVSGFGFQPGEVTVTGVDAPDSGVADAGAVSAAPPGAAFVPNLVPNGALEDGGDVPSGWKIEGDNSGGAAGWAKGGAWSGKRAFRLDDRGPYASSADRKPGDPYVPGGKPGGNYASARVEVSARWVSDPSPATPGTVYQASAFYWYANRTFLDRGEVNPVSIQFLDADKKVLPPADAWADWFVDLRALTRTGWVFVPSRPVTAPPQAAFVRLAVRMPHAFLTADGELPAQRRTILVDNLSLYALPPGADASTPDLAFTSAAAARALPFVPSSPGHRPNSFAVEVEGSGPGGLVARPYGQKQAGAVTVRLQNYLGDARSVQLDYEIVDIGGKTVHSGKIQVAVPSFGAAAAPVELPADLPYGPYLVRYAATEPGSADAMQGEARCGIAPPRETTPEERGRADYPYATWMPGVPGFAPTRADLVGRLAEAAGVGKTWFGADTFYLDSLIAIQDPAARHEAVEKRIARAREVIAYWRKYGVTPMGHFQNTQLLDPAQYPVLAEVVKEIVAALKGDIHYWRHGTEAIHGGVKELDRATADGTNGQGGKNYLYWGRKGTVRQYWTEYEVAFKAAKEADPGCVFGPQSASDTEGDVLRSFFRVLTPKDLDSFGMNTYISAYSIWPPNVRELARHGLADLPLYVSEFAAQGASATKPDHLHLEEEASIHQVTYWSQVLQSFPNLFQLEEWGLILGNDDGSLTFDNHVRPQFLAYAEMTNLMGAGRFTAKYDLPGTTVLVRHRSVRAGYAALVYAAGDPRPVDLDAGASPEVYDLWGNRLATSVDGGVLTVQAAHEPVYVVSDQEIKPHMGVEISVDPATLDADHPRVTVTLRNRTGQPAPGRLELIQSGPLKIADRVREVKSLDAGAEAAFTFDVTLADPLPGRRLPVKVRYTVGRKVYEMPGALNFDTARQAAAPLAVDADPAGWKASEFRLVADRKDQFYDGGSPKPWGGPADLSARGAVRWDDRFLYVFFQVTDDVDAPPDRPGHQWQRDGVELFVDASRLLTSDAPFTMFSLARYPGGPKLLRYDGALPQGEVAGAKIAARRTGTLTCYEAAIPWEGISPGFRPASGKTIALGWWVDDHDGGDSGVRKIGWFVTGKDPAQFGDVTLVGAKS